MVLHHFGFDQFVLAVDLQRYPGDRPQRTDVADLGGAVLGHRGTRQRHFVGAEQQVLVVAQLQAVGVAEEVVDEIAGRVLVDLAGRADLLDHALVHHHDAVGHFHRFFLVVGDEHRGQVDLLVQARQPAAQLLAYLGVEGAEGFVEEQDLRLHRQRAGQGDTLPLATGELLGIAVGEPVELHHVEQLVDLGLDRGFARPLALGLHAQAEGDVVEHRHVAEQRVVLEDEADVAVAHVVLRDVLAMEHDVAGVRGFQPGDDPQQGGLAAPGGPSRATSSPLWMSRLMLSRALKALKFLLTLRISILMVHSSSALLFSRDMRDSLHCLSRRMTSAISSNRLATLKAATWLYSL
ncbi:Uncharacterised protein [Pseudomonas aeruginosa]|nr:Uncharacterised protein [Pseudomonas aeruginosa]